MNTTDRLGLLKDLHQKLQSEGAALSMDDAMNIALVRKSFFSQFSINRKLECAVITQMVREACGKARCNPYSLLVVDNGPATRQELDMAKQALMSIKTTAIFDEKQALERLFPLDSVENMRRSLSYLFVYEKAKSFDYLVIEDVLVHN